MSRRQPIHGTENLPEARYLANLFSLRRRYTRSVNIERDLTSLDGLDGYVPTARALEVLGRIALAQAQEGVSRAWTLTGVYGTGKSAFAHFAASLYGPADDVIRRRAIAILRAEANAAQLVKHFKRFAPEAGFVRAVAVGRREPIAQTVVRALMRGTREFWSNRTGRRPLVLEHLRQLELSLTAAPARAAGLAPGNIAELVADVSRASQTGLLLVVDELGKALEFAVHSGMSGDMHLLQELAELSADRRGSPVFVIGLLHQAYSEYGYGLTRLERGDWEKIQGRFEDVPFADSGEQTLRVVGRVIEPVVGNPLYPAVERVAKQWESYVRRDQHSYIADTMPAARIAAFYPLHPIAALILPSLCAKYAQNDRSLFTFLTSNEPNSLARFLLETIAPSVGPTDAVALPMLKLPRVYDYFVDSAGSGMVARPQFQRWAEIHSVIRDAAGLSEDELEALKVVGTLNLVGSSGPIRASKALCVAALLDRPGDAEEMQRWGSVLENLHVRGVLTYRQQVDEYRLWEGSDFDVEEAVREYAATDHRPIAEILTSAMPLSPIVAQRHSYRTGTLRFFERHYVSTTEELATMSLAWPESDGVVAYWTGDVFPATAPPATTLEGRPLVVIPSTALAPLKAAALEYAALVAIDQTYTALQADGVARREVRQRLTMAQRAIADAIHLAFSIDDGRSFWAAGEHHNSKNLGVLLSELCDACYHKGPVLWNELVNRRELTSQGARARRELLEALLVNTAKPRLGLMGDGPEVSMYASVLLNTGIHREEESRQEFPSSRDAVESTWVVSPPRDAGVAAVWSAVEAFCLQATTEPRSIDELYRMIEAPPYGVKRGIIPVILAAVLIYHNDDVSVYRDGTFLPTLGGEHFEILVKQPGRFAVKHFSLAGIRLELFQELESVLRRADIRYAARLRNATLLGVVRPLVRFATSLPAVTRRTRRLSPESLAVRDSLLSSTQPDVLVFESLPAACGFEPFVTMQASGHRESPQAVSTADAQRAEAFRHALVRTLRELQSYHEHLLDFCRVQIHSAFSVRSDVLQLREDLRVRSQYLVGRVLDQRLRSFVLAAANADMSDRDWIESLSMIVADKPTESWTDEDAIAFELNVSDIARRFANLEALQKESARDGREGFDARRITVTRSDGNEVNRLVWIDREERGFVNQKVGELLNLVDALPNQHHRHAVAMALVEALLTEEQSLIEVGVGSEGAERETTLAEVVARNKRRRSKP